MCAACSSKKMVLALQSSKPLRVCDSCFHAHGKSQSGSPSADDLKRMSVFSQASTSTNTASAAPVPTAEENAGKTGSPDKAEDDDEEDDENDDDEENDNDGGKNSEVTQKKSCFFF